MATIPERFSFTGIGDLPSAQRHNLVMDHIASLRALTIRFMETGGVPFDVIHPSGEVTEVSQEYIQRECGALFDMGYNLLGEYKGVMPPHEAADAADAFLATLRRGR